MKKRCSGMILSLSRYRGLPTVEGSLQVSFALRLSVVYLSRWPVGAHLLPIYVSRPNSLVTQSPSARLYAQRHYVPVLNLQVLANVPTTISRFYSLKLTTIRLSLRPALCFSLAALLWPTVSVFEFDRNSRLTNYWGLLTTSLLNGTTA